MKKRKNDVHTLSRSKRGFGEYGSFESVWHGNINVAESSAAFNGACVWIFGELSYSNTPKENAPHFHLQYEDAKKLRDNLTRFLRAAKAGETFEAAGPVPSEESK